jgi:HTH-type transcriptional regulator / antitoxin HigA
MSEEQRLLKLDVLPAGKMLRGMMDERGWTADELALIIGKSSQTIYAILNSRNAMSIELATALSAAFGNPPEQWLEWDNLYRLSVSEVDTAEVEQKARLFKLAPIRDMQKRGWIEMSSDPLVLEKSLKKFFERETLDLDDADIGFPMAHRRTLKTVTLSPAEMAWCYRARQLAKSFWVEQYAPHKLGTLERKLRKLAAYPKEIRQVPTVLSEAGIRLVVVEPIPGVKIDGAAFWLDSEPVIALSLRHDRIDGFWFTLMHELGHIRYGDASVDADLIDGTKGVTTLLVEDEAEVRANQYASESLIPKDEMQSFIRRVGPHYPKNRVVQFANRVRIHPGIIVGQLQHRNELGYSALREWLVKIREVVISTALTDGWGQNLALSTL